MPHKHYIRILLISWVIYGLCINTVFQTYVTSYLVDPGFEYQIRTYEELSNNFYSIYIPSLTVFSQFQYNNSYWTLLFTEALRYTVGNTKAAILVPREVFVHGYSKYCRNNPPTFFILDDVVHLGVRYKFLDNLNSLSELKVVMARLVESGIPDKIAKEISDPKGTTEALYKPTFLTDEYYPLSHLHLQSPFFLYLGGIFVSFVVFLSEIVTVLIKTAITNFKTKFLQ